MTVFEHPPGPFHWVETGTNIMPYSYTDSEVIIYIADLGPSPSVYFNGKDEPIHRYAVWNNTKTKIMEYSDDLQFLRDKSDATDKLWF